MRLVGIDPGVNGAAACIETEGPRLVDAVGLEIIDLDRAAAVVDAAWLLELLASWAPDAVAVERQGPMGRAAGASQLCKLSAVTGSLVTVLQLARTPVQYVAPARWKARVGLIKADKAKALDRAALLFGPHDAWRHGRGRGPKGLAIARAEAALIAWSAWLGVFRNGWRPPVEAAARSV